MSDYLSYSQIRDGLCPHRYKLIRIDKTIERPETIQLLKGKFNHAVANEYVTYCMRHQTDGDYDAMKKIFYENWQKFKIPELYYDELKNLMLTFGEKEVNFNNVIGTEIHFRVEVAPGVFIEGYIDIARTYKFRGLGMKGNDDILHLFDYKSTRQVKKPGEILTDFQLKIYTLAALLKLYPGYKYVRRGIYYLPYNCIVCYEDEDNPTSIEDALEEVEETRKMIIREFRKLKGAKSYPAVTGEHCYEYSGCPVLLAGKCPKIKDNVSNIEDTIRKAMQIKTQLSDITAFLKSYFKTNDKLIVDGKEIGYEKSTDEIYPFIDTYNFCNQVKYNLEHNEFPKTIINDVIKEIKSKVNSTELIEALDKIRIEIDSSVFKGV